MVRLLRGLMGTSQASEATAILRASSTDNLLRRSEGTAPREGPPIRQVQEAKERGEMFSELLAAREMEPHLDQVAREPHVDRGWRAMLPAGSWTRTITTSHTRRRLLHTSRTYLRTTMRQLATAISTPNNAAGLSVPSANSRGMT